MIWFIMISLMGHECSEPCIIYTCTTRVEGYVFLNFSAGVKYSLGVNIDICINMTTRLYDFILISFCKYFRLEWALQMKNKCWYQLVQMNNVHKFGLQKQNQQVRVCICNHFERKKIKETYYNKIYCMINIHCIQSAIFASQGWPSTKFLYSWILLNRETPWIVTHG